MRTPQNKRSIKQINKFSSSVLKLRKFLSNPLRDKKVESLNFAWLENRIPTANYLTFHLELNATYIRYPEVEAWRGTSR